ncbi:hypothetical protein Acr_15g0004890 [Actinidia rufa]|uniref:Uncharacterized protein n=1 Tax=Actinidia rufa TaxID=165716 RepID=A0A7J0FUN2_9ERIC|nr:hypothetical protein Acr_15g0004890 [Actinidia rufa]
MSENRDNSKGVEDEGKKLEDMKAKQEAEIEQAKDSSTPLKETATDAKSVSRPDLLSTWVHLYFRCHVTGQ